MIHKWGIFEFSVNGPQDKNPFADYYMNGVFKHTNETVKVDGFYDGEGIYKVRFMPSFTGTYTFHIESNFELEHKSGKFDVKEAETNNHGPVRTANTFHFAYEDGTAYYPIGTTCYVWHLQSDELIEETLCTLKKSAFNKVRFCVLPKHYAYNLGEPRLYPYEGTPINSSTLTTENFSLYNGSAEGNKWDFKRFNTAYFKHLETCIVELQKLGMEADLIVFHPYDRWGFSEMNSQEDALYFKYLIARLSAFHNVWWSLANEYDLMEKKSFSDWERLAELLCEKDAYHHLKSIHNCIHFYDHMRPWITHCSIQRNDIYKTSEMVNVWREKYRKPIVLDEISYEGNIQLGWGNISGKEMVRRFWEAVCRGGYPGHGETYVNDKNILWWSHGGTLHGESHLRVGFLLDILKEAPGIGLEPYHKCDWDEVCAVPDMGAMRVKSIKDYYLYYYSFMQPSFREFYFDDETIFEAEVIDTWEMTRKKTGVFTGKFKVELPGKLYMAILIKRKI